MVFQDPTLYPWRTVRRNVALGLEARNVLRPHDRRIDDMLRLVGLEGFSHAYPHQLSGGMAQRAALARALVNEPAVMLLDEPLGKLDSLTRITMQSELMDLWQRERFTALLVTHDIEEALFLASRVIVLSQRPARIVAEIIGRSALSAASQRPAVHRIAAGGVGASGTCVDLVMFTLCSLFHGILRQPKRTGAEVHDNP